MTRRLLALLMATAVVLGITAPAAIADHDDLPPERDNGAAGRDNGLNGENRPPPEVCDGRRSELGSRVVRLLPRGPENADGSLAYTSGICVYLPPGYDDAKPALRYPVLYLLHGGGGDQSDWVEQGQLQRIADDAYTADPADAVIVVTPDGHNTAGWYDSYDGTVRLQTYFFEHLVPYIDSHFRTIADRRGRVITGLSNGGYSAMHLAAKQPDHFVAAGAMSANLGFRATDQEINRSDAPAYKPGQTPVELAQNLGGLDLILDLGTECLDDLSVDLCAAWGFEQLFRGDNEYFVGRLREIGHPGVLDVGWPQQGAHAWRWWSRWLEERHLPFLLARAADPEVASKKATPSAPSLPFDYRTIAGRFSVHGYDVEVRRDVREFLDLSDVSSTGLSVTGSGVAEITTAALYKKGKAYTVSGAGAVVQRAVADGDGRLRFTVDLGPSHTHEQFSTEATALEAVGGYWTTRRVTIA